MKTISKMKRSSNEEDLRNVDDLKNEPDLKKEDDLKNKDDLENVDDLKIKDKLKTSLPPQIFFAPPPQGVPFTFQQGGGWGWGDAARHNGIEKVFCVFYGYLNTPNYLGNKQQIEEFPVPPPTVVTSYIASAFKNI